MDKRLEAINELSEEIKKVAWMLGINDTDLLALLLRAQAEGLDDNQILESLEDQQLPESIANDGSIAK